MERKAAARDAAAVMAQSRPGQSTMVIDRPDLGKIKFLYLTQGHELEIAENH